MIPPTGPEDEPREADLTLERVEERVRKVQHLEPFHFSQREDGRFRCELGKPIHELRPAEIRKVLSVLDTLAEVLREQLEEGGSG